MDIDDLLRRIGEQWRARHAAPLAPPEFDRAAGDPAQRTGPLGRRVVIPLVAAAVVVLVAVAATVLSRTLRGAPTPVTAGTASSSPTGTPSSASSSPPTSTSSSPPTSSDTSDSTAAACRSSQLKLVHVSIMAFMFHYMDIWGLKNTGDSPCSMQGYPKVAVYDSAGQQAAVDVQYSRTGMWGPRTANTAVTVQPGDEAGLYVGTVANPDSAGCVAYSTYKITPPGTGHALTPSQEHFGVCEGDTLYVSPVLQAPTPP